jgi:SAM-dependent methyltransferase
MNQPEHASGYVWGHAPAEIRRQMLQAQVLRPVTERLLRAAGIGPGMHVLDLGCGAGDVALLAAEMVGAAGMVIGVDRSAEMLTTAKTRAEAAGLEQLRFLQASVDDAVDRIAADFPVDAVIGRCILCYLPDPVDTLRRAAAQLPTTGVLAFHEMDLLGSFISMPAVPLWDRTGQWLFDTLRPTMAHPDNARRMIECFEWAGLSTPQLLCECPIGGGETTPLYAWLTECVRGVSSLLTPSALADAGAGDINTLESRLRQATMVACSQIVAPAQICAWGRRRSGRII